MQTQVSQVIQYVKYVGTKARKEDNIAGTSLVWSPGQIHGVPSALAARLAKHPDVWQIVDEAEVEADPSHLGTVIDVPGSTKTEVDTNLAAEALANLKQIEAEAAAKVAETTKSIEAATQQILSTEQLPASWEPLSKAEIAAFAQRNYNLQLDPVKTTKEDLVSRVVAEHNARATV